MSSRAPRTLALTLAYDGTPFVGWQRQAEGVSIQGLLEEALSRIEGQPVAVIGAGRTDAGVHACGQVASVRMATALDSATLRRALNAVLPPEVRVAAVEDADPSFHARYSAASKTYRYRIVNGSWVMPFEWPYVWHVPERLDVARMQAAAPLFEGDHDFAAFRGTGSSVKTTTRRVIESRVTIEGPDARATPWGGEVNGAAATQTLCYTVRADGFLRHMVRVMVGTLVEIAAGRREPSSIARALASGKREDAGITAPASGLCLVCVEYKGLPARPETR